MIAMKDIRYPFKVLPKLLIFTMIFISFIGYFRTNIASTQNPCCSGCSGGGSNQLVTSASNPKALDDNRTTLHHIVFGIGASAKLWEQRKEYIKLWWRPNQTRGYVWLDKLPEEEDTDNPLLPPLKISSDTSKFKYMNKKGDRSAIRISRIVMETLRLGLEDVRWFVMGDDDTFFVVDNLVRVLEKYDHNQFYYIGSSSESHLQNIRFSYNMAYGGGGFAISYALAKALERMQDDCIERYPDLYGSDDRIQACMAELGVPLIREAGFHQLDVYGNIFGLLAAHPVTPLISLHHLDLINPIFPVAQQAQALKRLESPMKLDSAGLVQQSICYDKSRKWTVSVSWGYAIQIFKGLISARELERPARTFLNWYWRDDRIGLPFNSRPVSRSGCQRPSVYAFNNVEYNPSTDQTVSEYVIHGAQDKDDPACKTNIAHPSHIHRVKVYKKPNPYLWDKAPRRNCCRILPSKNENTMVIDVGVCREDETV